MSKSQIQFSKKKWPSKLNFIQGDAEKLSTLVPPNSIDYVIDIESSFFYPDKTGFFREVNTVMKNDGTFILGFLAFRGQVPQINASIKMYFDITKEADITDNAIRSLKLDTPNVSQFIDDKFGLFFRTFIRQAWALEGTILHRQLENKAIVYKTMVLKKKAP
jgi:ubiquinone/menaquinone biosynthesis C-methylase UbiE